jgi:hypothetical protein
VWLLISLVGCGGGDEPTDPTNGATTTPSGIAVLVTAEDGGTVEGGGGTLEIPAGALDEDTTITLALLEPGSLPEAGSVAGQVFGFGPTGTTFLTPATLTLPLPDAPAAGEHAVVSWLDGTTWVDLPTTEGTSEVSAPIAHFTMFAVRLVPDVAVDCSFAACGGPVTDIAWNLVGGCFDPAVLPPSCPTAVVTDNQVVTTGVYELVSATARYSFEIHESGAIAYDVPAECLGAYAACDDLDGPGFDCSGDAATACSCVLQVAIDGTETGDFEVVGNEISSLQDGESEQASGPYCVNGTELKLSQGGGFLLVFAAP